MNATRLIYWCFGLILAPSLTSGQNDYHPAAYTYNDAGNTISSNVPLNEINAHAWRNFHHLFPAATGEEYWFSSEEGYQVSFALKGIHYQALFSKRGGYRYSLHYYTGKELPRGPGELLRKKFPDYRVNVVTEITDGEKIVYLVNIVGLSAIKTISVCDGEIKVLSEQPVDSPPATADLMPADHWPPAH